MKKTNCWKLKLRKMKRFIEIELLGMHFFGVNSINAQRRENSDKIATTFGFCSLSFKSFRCQNQSVILVFFNAGQCGKDEICKFSHDPSVEHIVEKKYLMLMKQWIKLDWKEIEKKSSFFSLFHSITTDMQIFLGCCSSKISIWLVLDQQLILVKFR